jgi:hypothetical protein
MRCWVRAEEKTEISRGGVSVRRRWNVSSSSWWWWEGGGGAWEGAGGEGVVGGRGRDDGSGVGVLVFRGGCAEVGAGLCGDVVSCR